MIQITKRITLGNGKIKIQNNSGTPRIASIRFNGGFQGFDNESDDGFYLSSEATNNFRVGKEDDARMQFTNKFRNGTMMVVGNCFYRNIKFNRW